MTGLAPLGNIARGKVPYLVPYLKRQALGATSGYLGKLTAYSLAALSFLYSVAAHVVNLYYHHPILYIYSYFM